MKIITPVICSLITGVLVFLVMQTRYETAIKKQRGMELQNAVQSVQRELRELSGQMSERLAAFTDDIAADRDFSIKLLVENDRSAPVIAESAVRYKGAMGFDLLQLVDSAGRILSSGQFPASAGSSAAPLLSLLSETPVMVEDNVIGTQVLTFQMKKTFKIAEIPFYAVGGVMVDEKFLAKISQGERVHVVLRKGESVMGMQNVKSISTVTKNRILINDKEFSAQEIQVPFTGDGDAPRLIVVIF
jgi:hypothetical protein